VSKSRKAAWDALSPKAKRERLEKMAAGRGLKLKDARKRKQKPSSHPRDPQHPKHAEYIAKLKKAGQERAAASKLAVVA
jgi:hypothetical protein